jgi:hypothetical protein
MSFGNGTSRMNIVPETVREDSISLASEREKSNTVAGYRSQSSALLVGTTSQESLADNRPAAPC